MHKDRKEKATNDHNSKVTRSEQTYNNELFIENIAEIGQGDDVKTMFEII